MFNKYCIRKKEYKIYMDLNKQPNLVVYSNFQVCLYNCTTIIGENVRYFINKYDVSRDDWNSTINILYNKIDLYSTQHTLIVIFVRPPQSENYVSHVQRRRSVFLLLKHK